MTTEISQRELRNNSGQIMRLVGDGQTFTVTSNGEPVAELVPLRRRRFVRSAALIEAFRAAPPVDADRLRSDLDVIVDQDINPRV